VAVKYKTEAIELGLKASRQLLLNTDESTWKEDDPQIKLGNDALAASAQFVPAARLQMMLDGPPTLETAELVTNPTVKLERMGAAIHFLHSARDRFLEGVVRATHFMVGKMQAAVQPLNFGETMDWIEENVSFTEPTTNILGQMEQLIYLAASSSGNDKAACEAICADFVDSVWARAIPYEEEIWGLFLEKKDAWLAEDKAKEEAEGGGSGGALGALMQMLGGGGDGGGPVAINMADVARMAGVECDCPECTAERAAAAGETTEAMSVEDAQKVVNEARGDLKLDPIEDFDKWEMRADDGSTYPLIDQVVINRMTKLQISMMMDNGLIRRRKEPAEA